MTELLLSTQSQPVNASGRLSKTASYYAAFIGLGLAGSVLGPTLPGLAENTQTQLSQISFLFLARSLGYLIGSYGGGRLYDRLPGHPVMALALFGLTILLALVPLIPLLWLLILVVLLVGLVEGALDVGGNTLLVWIHRDQVGPFMNGLHFFFGVGSFIAPVILAQVLLRTHSISWTYWILAVLMLPMAVWLLRLPSPPRQTTAKDSLTGQVNYRLVILIVMFFFFYVGAEVGFGGWIFTYAVKLNLTDEATAAYLTSAFWGAYTIGRLLSIPIALRVRPRYILLADLLGCLVSLGLMQIWSHSLTAAWVGAAGVGLFMASVFPTTISLAARRMPLTGQITGWFFIGASAGAMVFPWLLGQLFDFISPAVMPLAFIIDLTLALIILFSLIAQTVQPNIKMEANEA